MHDNAFIIPFKLFIYIIIALFSRSPARNSQTLSRIRLREAAACHGGYHIGAVFALHLGYILCRAVVGGLSDTIQCVKVKVRRLRLKFKELCPFYLRCLRLSRPYGVLTYQTALFIAHMHKEFFITETPHIDSQCAVKVLCKFSVDHSLKLVFVTAAKSYRQTVSSVHHTESTALKALIERYALCFIVS